MEEIDLKELFIFIKTKTATILLIVIGVCLLGVFYSIFIQNPMYNSYTTVVLGGNENSNTQTITQNDITLNKNLVDTYAEIVKSRRVLGQVIDELELSISYDSLCEKISVSAVNETEIIKITVKDEDAIEAKNIANATAHYFSEEIVKLYNINNVNILDEAIVNKSPYNINIPKQLIIYILVGIVLAFGLVFVIFYFDRTIKTVEQVEQKIGLPILGNIEIFEKGGRRR